MAVTGWLAKTCMPTQIMTNPCICQVCISPDVTALSTVPHRPEGSRGNLKNEKRSDKQISTAKIVPEVITSMSPQMNHRDTANNLKACSKSYAVMKIPPVMYSPCNTKLSYATK